MYWIDSPKVTYVEVYEPTHYYFFTGPWVNLPPGLLHTVRVKGPDLYKWRQGAYIQDAFPYLSPDDREWMLNGYYSAPPAPDECELGSWVFPSDTKICAEGLNPDAYSDICAALDIDEDAEDACTKVSELTAVEALDKYLSYNGIINWTRTIVKVIQSITNCVEK